MNEEIRSFSKYYEERNALYIRHGEKIHIINFWDRLTAIIPSKRPENIIDIKDAGKIKATELGTLSKIS